MKKAKLTVHPSFIIGDISPRLFGAFLEPIGSMVNGSMYNPKHPSADELGLRKDFIQGLKDAGLPCVRLPGGNFVSGWNWKDSIGEKSQRKAHVDLAWYQFIPNDVGHDEYLRWAERVGTEPMYTINLGTGSMNDAIDIVEYTNFAGGTYWSDLRAKNGHKDPYRVKTWYLGNEVDGPWQIGSWEKDPRGYGVLAHETSKAMKWTDPTIETVACVSSSPFLRHYPDWDRQVLEQCYEMVDYISLHHYHSALPGDMGGLMAGYKAFEDYICTEIGLCDYLATKMRVKKKMLLSFDEYGSNTRPSKGHHFGMGEQLPVHSFNSFDPERKFVHHDPDDWSTRRRPSMPGMPSEVTRAIASSSVRLALLRHADRVKIGCSTGGLGELCMSDRENVWKGAAYYPFADLLRYAKGNSLECVVESEKYSVDGYAVDDMNQYAGFDDVDYIQSAAAHNEETGELTVFVINSDWEDEHLFTLDARGFAGYRFIGHTALYTKDPAAVNSPENPDANHPVPVPETTCDQGVVTARLEKLSWNVFRFAKAVNLNY